MPPRKRKTAAEAKAEADAVIAARIRESLVGWYPGKWAEVNAYGPACRCGKRQTPWKAAGGGVDDGRCQRHPEVNGEPETKPAPSPDGDAGAAG